MSFNNFNVIINVGNKGNKMSAFAIKEINNKKESNILNYFSLIFHFFRRVFSL